MVVVCVCLHTPQLQPRLLCYFTRSTTLNTLLHTRAPRPANRSANVRLPGGDYARIMRDLCSIGDTVVVSATKDGVRFSTTGDIGTANITVR